MRRWFSVWVGWVRVVSVIGVLFGLIIRIGDPAPLNILRNVSFDFYHQSKPREKTQLPVAILDVDDSSLEEFGQMIVLENIMHGTTGCRRDTGNG